MKTVENIKLVSLAFFIVLGLIHILSGLSYTDGFMLPTTYVTNRVLTIPFALTALVYAFSTIYLHLEEKSRPKAKVAFIAITIVSFILLVVLTFIFPDKV